MELTEQKERRYLEDSLEFRKDDNVYTIVPIRHETDERTWWSVRVALNGARVWASVQKNETYDSVEAACQRGFEYVKSVTKYK